MKREFMALSRRYGAALHEHLGQPSDAKLKTARGLGRQAMAIGLETLDMARIHEQALGNYSGNGDGESGRRRAGAFFAEANHPIEETHLGASETRARVSQLNETLQRRTVELATSHRQLKRKIVTRKHAEEALKQSGDHQMKLLRESMQLQQRLRRLTYRLLVGQENERTKISRGLRDEIAQTLLGINVRLLALKAGTAASTKALQKDIRRTQELVAKSARVIHRVARGFVKRP